MSIETKVTMTTEKLPDDVDTWNRFLVTSPLLGFNLSLSEATLLAAWLIVMAGLELGDDDAIEKRVALLVQKIREA